VARRDALAHERNRGSRMERQRSHELTTNGTSSIGWCTSKKQTIEGLRDQLRAAETELAEVDTWLRYRDLGA